MNLTHKLLISVALAFVLAGAAYGEGASRQTFLKLMDVQELWEEERYDEALVEIDKLLEKTRNDPYDYALANQYLAHTCVLADCPERIRPALEIALRQSDLPIDMLITLKLFYAQIVLVDEDFMTARRYFEEWLDLGPEKPAPGQLFSAAYSHYMTESFIRAEELLSWAISEDKNPQNSWYRLYYQTLMELERHDQAEQVVIDLVARAPNEEDFWRLLANHYLRLEDGRKALSVLTIAYAQDILTDTEDTRRIVSLYGFVEVPERAARMLDDLLARAVLESDFDTLKQLGDLWLLSRERNNAIEVLKKAAEVAPDGKTDELLGSIYFENEEWQLAHERFMRAIDRGGSDETERLHLLAGISAYRAGMRDEARTSLREAMKHDEFRSQARSVLRQLDDA